MERELMRLIIDLESKITEYQNNMDMLTGTSPAFVFYYGKKSEAEYVVSRIEAIFNKDESPEFELD